MSREISGLAIMAAGFLTVVGEVAAGAPPAAQVATTIVTFASAAAVMLTGQRPRG